VAGNSFRCYLLTYHTSCAVVSVFWLRREIVFGCTVSKKDSYLVSLGPSFQSSCMCMYVLLHTHIQQFTVLAVHFFIVDEKNLQQSEKIVIEFFHLKHFFCLYEDESSYTYKNILYNTARMEIVVYVYGFVLVFAR
jgi:hypothetical protein